jgi:hypothetical protein
MQLAARGLVGLRRALLPITQRTEGNVEARGVFFPPSS